MRKEKKVLAVQLKVAEAKQRDVGKARVRLDLETMESLGVGAGDVIELVGKEVTAAIAWPADPEDQGDGILRIDGQTRKNAGVGLNEYATVRKTDVKPAKSATLVPLSGRLDSDREFTQYVRNRLKGFPLMVGDEISVVILGNPIVFSAIKVKPMTVVKVEQDTRITIGAEPIADKKKTPRVTYDEIGGLGEIISRLREIVELPLRRPEIFQRLGTQPPNGILLYGPPGGGKTLLAKALANETEASFFVVNGPEIMNKYYGETEARLREIFKEARENAPGIIFLDEIDAIAPKREEAFGDVEKRVVAQLLALMDGLSERGDVVVVGATNRIESVDPALRRPGRFDREVEVGVPNSEGRLEILQIHTRGMPLDSDVDMKRLAEESYGYTGADLRALCREAALGALRRYLPAIDIEGEALNPKVLDKMVIKGKDFRDAFKEIVPTAMREFYVETPSVRLEEVGGLVEVKRILQENVILSIKNPKRFEKVGISPPTGVLLYGPPGCGKTLIARAAAAESGANFITIGGPEILSKWVGESEKAIREVFRKAKLSTPCIIFFDEIDSIAKSRSLEHGESGVNERVLSQLLTEMDATHFQGDVFVLAATNRLDLLDLSLLRPGRLDLLVYVPPPDEAGRLEILKMATAKMPLEGDVDIGEIGKATPGYTGADLDALCREAALTAMRTNDEDPKVDRKDFEQALKVVRASVTPKVESWYETVAEQVKGSPGRDTDKSLYR